jgi:hypothetical protein
MVQLGSAGAKNFSRGNELGNARCPRRASGAIRRAIRLVQVRNNADQGVSSIPVRSAETGAKATDHDEASCAAAGQPDAVDVE